MSQMITFPRPDGKECSGYYAEPATGASAPGVVVIQEWWGLNEQIRSVADRLATAGYRSLVPDLYRGKVTLDAKEAEHLSGGLDFADAASQDIRGAVAYLKGSGAKAGVMGFCMGGALTLLAAVHVPESDASVTWYGYPPLEYIDATKIKAPLQGHWAIDDAFFPVDQIDTLEEKLNQAGVKFEFYRYKAQHAFGNQEVTALPIPAQHDRAAAELAWLRTMTFLKQNL